MFSVETDLGRNRVLITLVGFATFQDVERFRLELVYALSTLPAHRGPHQILYDVSQAKIQSQEVVSALHDIAANSPKSAAFALVNASALAGRQLRRIFVHANFHIFEERHKAILWLNSLST